MFCANAGVICDDVAIKVSKNEMDITVSFEIFNVIGSEEQFSISALLYARYL